jgi:hypothetical protein
MSGPNQFLRYTAPDGALHVDVYFKHETVWLTQKALATLFGVMVPAISSRGVKRAVEYGNLDAIIAVGF